MVCITERRIMDDRPRSDTVNLDDDAPQYTVEISDASVDKNNVKFTIRIKYMSEPQGNDNADTSVKRRHEDFQWLHNTFVENDLYNGYLIPVVPPTPDFEAQKAKLVKLSKSDATMGAEELKKLKVELEAEYLALFKKTVSLHETFLQRLARHPVFHNDINLKIFLTHSGDMAVRGKNSKERISGYFSSIGKSADELLLANQKDSNQFFITERALITQYLNQVNECGAKSEKMSVARKNFANSLIEVSPVYAAMSHLEKDAKLEKCLASMSETLENIRKIENKTSADEDLKLTENLLRLYGRESSAIKSLLYRRLRCLSNFEATNRHLEKARLKNKDVRSAEDAQKRADEIFTNFETRGKSEIQDFKKRKVASYKRCLTELAETEIKHAYTQVRVLQAALENIKEIPNL